MPPNLTPTSALDRMKHEQLENAGKIIRNVLHHGYRELNLKLFEDVICVQVADEKWRVFVKDL